MAEKTKKFHREAIMKTVKRIISVGLLLVTLFIAGYLVFTGRQREADI